MGNGDWVNVGAGQKEFTYEKKVRKEVGKGPRGGKLYETRIETITSTERHAHNRVTGQDITIRQAQNIQHGNRENSGIPKTRPVQRIGKTRTLKELNKRGFSTLYDKERHGNGQAIYFTDLESARNYVLTNGIEKKYNNIVLQVHYKKKLRETTKKVNGVNVVKGSPPRNKEGFATLTSFNEAKIFTDGANYAAPNARGEIENPWYTAEKRLEDYELDDNSRIILLMTER